ncbi:MAG: hypothetical protein RLZZ507_3019 [Cyanobacteriota bacterium]|jgi:hypothetical protein
MKLFEGKLYASAPVLLTLCLVGWVPEAQAQLVLDVNPGGTQVPCGSCGNISGRTVGWSFGVTNSFTVDGIGVWDSGSDGIGTSPIQAGLWRSDGTLLASVLISNSSTPVASASTSGQWLFEDISQLTLTPGNYLIGSIFFNSTPLANIGSVTTIPDITVIAGAIGGSGADTGFQAPTNSFGTVIYGPTLRQASGATPVPFDIPGGATIPTVGSLFALTLMRKAKKRMALKTSITSSVEKAI